MELTDQPSWLGQVGAWYTLSEPYKRPAEESTSVGDTASGEKVGATAEGAQPQERTTYAQLVEHMIPMAGGREGPPPSLSRHGEFSDWVYTIPTAKYDRKEVCPPPPPRGAWAS